MCHDRLGQGACWPGQMHAGSAACKQPLLSRGICACSRPATTSAPPGLPRWSCSQPGEAVLHALLPWTSGQCQLNTVMPLSHMSASAAQLYIRSSKVAVHSGVTVASVLLVLLCLQHCYAAWVCVSVAAALTNVFSMLMQQKAAL